MGDYFSRSCLETLVSKALHSKFHGVPVSSLFGISNPEVDVVESIKHSNIRLSLRGTYSFSGFLVADHALA